MSKIDREKAIGRRRFEGRDSSRQLRNPINDMPPCPEKLLSDKDVADIYAFLQALPGRRAIKDISILNN
jgi:mono/diheme cytochrome c family protein